MKHTLSKQPLHPVAHAPHYSVTSAPTCQPSHSQNPAEALWLACSVTLCRFPHSTTRAICISPADLSHDYKTGGLNAARDIWPIVWYMEP